MVDIAQIGFRADTKELAKAEAQIEALVPAATKAEGASERLEKSINGVSAAAGRQAAVVAKSNGALVAAAGASNTAAAGISKVGEAADVASGKIDRMQANANDNIARIAAGTKANVGNIAAQFQDIGVTAAMGMNPLLIALQQGTQLSAVFAASGESLGKTLATAFASIISPVALLTIALVALAAAGLQMIDWVNLAQGALNLIAEVLPQVAAYAVMAGAALAVAFAPAIVASIWGIATALTTGLLAAVGAIATSFLAIPAIIGLVAASIIGLLGYDVIEVVHNTVNLIIGSFIAAYHDILFVWNNFGQVFGAAILGGFNLAIKGINKLVQLATDGMNAVIDGVNVIRGALGADLLDNVEFSGFDEITNIAAQSLAGAVEARNAQLKKDLTTDYIGAIGGAVADASTYVSDKLKSLSAGLDTADGGKKKKGEKSDSEKFDDIVKGAEASIRAMEAEQAALGMTAEAAAKLKYETQLLNEANQKNIELTPTMREAISGLAAEMARLEVGTDKAKEAIDFAKGLFKGFVSDLKSGLEQGKDFWEALGDAAMNVLDKIVDKLLNDVIDALFEVQDAGGGGSLLGGIAQALFSAKGNVFDGGNVVPFAKGGSFTNGVVDQPTQFAMGVMGEAGPEAIMPLERGSDGRLGVVSHDSGQAGGGVIVQIINNNAPNTQVRERRSKLNDGTEVRQFVIDTVNEGTNSGEMDGSQRTRFGNRVSGITR